jgi:beta-galactosidase
MKSGIFLFIAGFLVLLGCSRQDQKPVAPVSFNQGWAFRLLEEGAPEVDYPLQGEMDREWERVDLPHTPRIEPLVVNDQWQGTCWYRKHFNLPASFRDQRIYLKFEGAMNVADVWLNGTHLIRHQGGYLPFVAELTGGLNFDGENLLAVRLDNRDNPVTGPKPLALLDFNTYGGLYRNVWLIAKAPLHITDPILASREAGGGVFVTFPEVTGQRALISVKTHVSNEQEKREQFRIVHQLFRDGEEVLAYEGGPLTLEAGEERHFSSELELFDPLLWSPEHPYLYTLVTLLRSGHREVDREETRIGIRKVEFNGQELLLNGEPLFLRGVNRHQEYPYIGYALSDQAQYRDAWKIKQAGFDYVRLSHYPHSPAFMDACDELGIVTIDAILGWQYFSQDTAFVSHVLQTARELIRRDRNHPSVLAWEVSLNESWMPEWFIDSLTRIAHREYPGDQCFTAGWQSYGYDLYLQARQHRLHRPPYSGGKPYVVSEYGDWEYYAMNAGLDQDRWGDLLPEERSSRQLRGDGIRRLMQQARNLQEAHNDNFNTPAFADGYWVMYDYNRGYADDLEASGIMDIFRIPKPSCYFFRSQRDADEPPGAPMVHIANLEPVGDHEIRIFSNCHEVELFLDGQSVGRQGPDRDRFSDHLAHPPFTFRIGENPFTTLRAEGFLDGEMAVETERFVPGEADHIVVSADTSGQSMTAGTGDILFIYATLCDERGTAVPINGPLVRFRVEGDALLLGENPAPVEAGIASILIRAGRVPGTLRVSATGEGLAEGRLQIDSNSPGE